MATADQSKSWKRLLRHNSSPPRNLLRRSWPALRAHRYLLLAAAVLPALVYSGLVQLRAPVYTSHALLELQMPHLSGSRHSDLLLAAELQTTGTLIGSTLLRDRAMEALSSYTADRLSDEARADFFDSLQVRPLPGTRLLELQFSAANPDLARDGANALINAWISYEHDRHLQHIESETSSALALLDALFNSVQTDLSAVDSAYAALPSIWPPDPVHEADWRKFVGSVPGAELEPWAGFQALLETAVVESVVTGFKATITDPARVRVVEYAQRPMQAAAALSWTELFMASFLSLLIVSLILVLRLNLKNTISFSEEAVRRLRLPVLAALPRLQDESARGPEPGQRRGFLEHLAFAEAVRSLRTRLRLRAPNNIAADPVYQQCPQGRVVLITSSRNGEGKTTLATNLALSLGQVEKVLLIDTNLRKAHSCATFCGLPAGSPGLSHLIAGAAQLKDCIHRLSAEGIDVLPCGVLPPNPQELLSSKRFSKIMQALSRRYDYLIIDAPPMQQLTDTLLLRPFCTDLLYVVRADDSTLPLIRQGLQALRSEQTDIQLVINAVDSRRARRYGAESQLDSLPETGAYAYAKPRGRYLLEH